MILDSIPAIRELTLEQKMRLFLELAEEVARETEDRPEIMELLNERLNAYEADPTAVKTTAEVTAGISALKQRLAAS